MKIAVLGAGAWGTALAAAWADEHDVWLWARNAELIATLQREGCNPRYLPEVSLPATLRYSADLAASLDGVDIVILAVSTGGLAATLERLPASLTAPLVWVCKGFEKDTFRLPHQVVGDWRPGYPCAVLSGPSFAYEVARHAPTALTLASTQPELAERLTQALAQARLRIYVSDDVLGVEIGGALKNVMAIASGVCDGLALGHNARAALVTRGLAELTRLGIAMGGKTETFMGLSGLGDLILTTTGDLSRNRRVGLALAQGQALDDILAALGHVAEGVNTAREVAAMADKLGVEMPITTAVARMLFDGLAATDAVDALLARSIKSEF